MRSRWAITQQFRIDLSFRGPLHIFLAGIPPVLMMRILDNEAIRARVNYTLERMILANVSSHQDRIFWLSFLPYIDVGHVSFFSPLRLLTLPSYIILRTFSHLPLEAHLYSQLLGIVPPTSLLPEIFSPSYWTNYSSPLWWSRETLFWMIVFQDWIFLLASNVASSSFVSKTLELVQQKVFGQRRGRIGA